MAIPYERCIDLATAEIGRMADVCRGAEAATPVATCPGWDLAQLQRHVGRIHRWAATMVAEGSQERLPRERMDWPVPEDPAALPDWVAEGAAFAEDRFRAADPATAMWAWGWPKTAGFWPRRMIHETSVHRADAELALGRAPSMDAECAADAVDELLDNLPHAAYFAPPVAELRGDGEVLTFTATDTGAAWVVRFRPDGFSWSREAAPSTATVTTPTATDLVLTLYGRRPVADGEVTGDASLVERWLTHTAQ
jgi:uncharacterized protein (TIGR03083 family)